MINAGTHGAVTWADLSTPDVEAATHFYQRLFDWQVSSSQTPMGEYFIGKVGSHELGGLMQQVPEEAGNPALWTTFIYTNDIDATVARVPQANGTVLEKPFEIPGDARVAVAADPTGAMFALFGGPEIQGSFYSLEPGAVCWVELLTRDPAAAEVFYGEIFGWKAETSDAGGTRYTMFKLNGDDVAGMMQMPDEVPAEAPSHWSLYFTVADCEATEHRAVALGGQVLRPTTEIEIGKFAVLADPQGAKFNLMEYRA